MRIHTVDPTLNYRKQIDAKAHALGHELNRWRGTPGDRKVFCKKCRQYIFVYVNIDGISCEGTLFDGLKKEVACRGF